MHRCQHVAIFRRKTRSLSLEMTENTINTAKKNGIISLTFTA